MLIKYLTRSPFDFSPAKSIGKCPLLLGKKKLAPFIIKVFAEAKSPLKQHQCNAVHPLIGSIH